MKIFKPSKILLSLALAGSLLLTAACQDTTTATATVSNGNRLAPLSVEEINKATAALKTLPPAESHWENGVVLEEYVPNDSWPQWRVLTGNGVVVLTSSVNCDSSELIPLISPGDGITWSLKGNDRKVCNGEVKLTVLAVTERIPG